MEARAGNQTEPARNLGTVPDLPELGLREVTRELTARNLYTYYKADIYAYVRVMQNINRELCRRLRRADDRIAELQMLHASQ